MSRNFSLNARHITEKEVEEIINAILINYLDADAQDIDPENKLSDDLGLDSLDQVELCMEAERQLRIQISDQDWEEEVSNKSKPTLNDVYLCVKKRVPGLEL